MTAETIEWRETIQARKLFAEIRYYKNVNTWIQMLQLLSMYWNLTNQMKQLEKNQLLYHYARDCQKVDAKHQKRKAPLIKKVSIVKTKCLHDKNRICLHKKRFFQNKSRQRK